MWEHPPALDTPASTVYLTGVPPGHQSCLAAFNGGGTTEDQILWETDEDPTGVLNRAHNANGLPIYGPARRLNLGFSLDF